MLNDSVFALKLYARTQTFYPTIILRTKLRAVSSTDNFYRRVNQALDLHFLYKSTQKHYGTQGQESIHKPLYDKMHQKLTNNKAYHRRLVKRGSSTVEHVLGTLINHHNMRRINSRGMAQANKYVLMTALCYNLMKYLKFIRKQPHSIAQIMSIPKGVHFSRKIDLHRLSFSLN